eukprot:TRINITY_DN41644_c0_g1_i1.p1 TRINITY_DN41644_c0_g1~~TRINITY_DN41644_c0_g1_i1.p1  ORF type:complete len:441 (-),score=82.39 TRINITY_DN41644_c0_g1_i1:110-1255(-)
MAAMPGFDPAAWAGLSFPTAPQPSTNSLQEQLKEASAALNKQREKDNNDRMDKVDRTKAPPLPPGGEVIRLRGLPWSAGTQEVANFLREYGIRESHVVMCVTKEGRQDGHAWVVFDDKRVAQRAMDEKQRQTIGGRFIELFPWKDHSNKPPVAVDKRVYAGVLKHFDFARKCGYIFCPEAEQEIGKTDIYAFREVLERGRASVGDTLAFPLHWSAKGQPQASSPLIRLASVNGFAHAGTFQFLDPSLGGKQGGLIECKEMRIVFGRGVYVSPSLAIGLVPGSTVAFNCYMSSIPASFAKPPMDGPNVPIASSVKLVGVDFESPPHGLNETRTADGFEPVSMGPATFGPAKGGSKGSGLTSIFASGGPYGGGQGPGSVFSSW